jgi:uncharacterized protein (DUF2141 family)
MKTQLLSSLRLSLALLSLAFAAQAQTEPAGALQAAAYPIQNSMKVRLFVVNPEAKAVRILIRDQNGKVRYQDTYLHLTKFHRAFDLAELGDGTYTISVVQGKNAWSQDVTVETTSSRTLAMSIKATPEPRLEAAPILASKP